MTLRTLRCIRHGRPTAAYAERRFLRSDRMNAALDAYDRAGIIMPEKVLVPIEAEAAMISSDLPRAVETAEVVTGRSARIFQHVSLFREVPLPRFKSRILYLPPGAFILLARARWLMGVPDATETFSLTMRRVRQAIEFLNHMFASHSEIVLFSHCLFMRCLQWEMSKQGWSRSSVRPFGYFEERAIRSDGSRMVSRKIAL